MGRPLKIQKQSTGSGNGGASVLVDAGYPPFTSPTSIDLPTVVLPTPTTTSNFMGVVGGDYTLSSPSPTYPVVEVQVNIALPSGVGQGAANGRIIRQKGARKFLVASSTVIQDENLIAGAAYQILALGTTNWQSFGAPVGAVSGTIFTATANGTNSGNGTALLVGQCVLKKQAVGSLTVGNMSITMSIGDSAATYISKLTNKFAQDFNGGETGGNANTGNVWDPAQVINDIAYAANFFEDGEQFVKSGADLPTWAASNGSDQNSNGTLTTAVVENYTS